LTFASDLAFYATSNEFWATASFWLLGIGLITAALAAATGLIDAFGEWQDSRPVDTRVHAVSNAIALLIALYNWYSRFEHGSSAVVPTGVVLSELVVLVLIIAGWKGEI
jgi:uncharacterized membrane protein